MSGTLYLVRHGRTALNRDGRFRGRRDPPLDETGRAEAKAAAGLLMDVGLTAINTSPLLRATQSADPIAAASGAAVRVVRGLTDLDYGHWEGLTPDEARTLSPEEFDLFRGAPFDTSPPGGESVERLKNRALRCIQQIREVKDNPPAAVVTHEMVIRR